MSSRLDKAPDGLLGTFDLKTLGRNPDKFGDTVEPGIDVAEFYLLRSRTCQSSGGAFASLGTATGTLIVPNAEIWRVNLIGVLNVRAAADIALTLRDMVVLNRSGGGTICPVGVAQFGPVVATDLTQYLEIPLTAPLWLGGGDRLRLLPYSTQTVAGSNLTFYVDYNVVPSG